MKQGRIFKKRGISSVQFSCSVMSGSLQPHGLQHAGFPVLHHLLGFAQIISTESMMPSNHLILSLSLPLLPSIFPSIRVFSWVGSLHQVGQSFGASASASVLPMSIQGWFPLGLTGLISLLSKGFWRVFSRTTVWKHQFFGAQASLWGNSYRYMTTGKTIALTMRTFAGKVMSLLFNTLFRLVIAFLPRSRHLLISWL